MCCPLAHVSVPVTVIWVVCLILSIVLFFQTNESTYCVCKDELDEGRADWDLSKTVASMSDFNVKCVADKFT